MPIGIWARKKKSGKNRIGNTAVREREKKKIEKVFLNNNLKINI